MNHWFLFNECTGNYCKFQHLFWRGQEPSIAKGAKTQIPFLKGRLTKCCQDLIYGTTKPGPKLVTTLLPQVCLIRACMWTPVLYKLEALNEPGRKMRVFWSGGILVRASLQDKWFPPWKKQDRRWYQTMPLVVGGCAVTAGIKTKVWAMSPVGIHRAVGAGL